ncbi:hypothetical protein [Amycolatopsis japonica]|uniref:hypothetical protein n=1 Tax=Amycolatopsis japonica TaxID=208439 RepID=UPI0033FEC554
MRIRVEGTETEVAAAVAAIATVVEVQEASGFYPNRGASVLGRVYLTVAPLGGQPGPVQATAERTEQPRPPRIPRGRREIR